MIDVLVVEDSAVLREFLVHVLGSDPGLRVVATARNGREALEAVRRHRPHVITMDIHMPVMDGLETTRQIMATQPTPIVIVSGSYGREVANTFAAIDAGAIAVLPRPAAVDHPEHASSTTELIRTVKLMAEVKVIRRWPRTPRPATPLLMPMVKVAGKVRVVALGASTGGPPVLKGLLEALPSTFPAPLMIVQHMATGFVEGFVNWLAQTSAIPVSVAVHGQPLLSGRAYVAPDGYHLKFHPDGRVALGGEQPENGLRPSVSALFRSIADACPAQAVAGLLSGMGRDGAEELRVLRAKGAVTFAQDRESAVVHGMPGEAIRLDAAALVLSPERMAPVLTRLVNGVARIGGTHENE